MFLKLLLSVLPLLADARLREEWPCKTGDICNNYSSVQDCVDDSAGHGSQKWECCVCKNRIPPEPAPKPLGGNSDQPCVDDENFTWKINSNKRNCLFLRNNPNPYFRERQCNRTLESIERPRETVQVKNKCRRTCNNCAPENCDQGDEDNGGCQGSNSCWKDSKGRTCSWYAVDGWPKPRCMDSYQWATENSKGELEFAMVKCCNCRGFGISGQEAGDGSEVSSLEEQIESTIA